VSGLKTKVRVGDLVQSDIHGYHGWVFMVYPTFISIPTVDAYAMEVWFKTQKPPIHPALKKKPWIEVLLLKDGDSVLVPMGTVSILVPFAILRHKLEDIIAISKSRPL